MSLVCYWCVCFVAANSIKFCQPCGQGTQQDAVMAMKRYALGSSWVFNTECVEKGEKPTIDWEKKNGFGKAIKALQ